MSMLPHLQTSLPIGNEEAEEMITRALHVVVATLGLASQYPGLSQ